MNKLDQQLFDNINTLVEMSQFSIKLSINGHGYVLQGLTRCQEYDQVGLYDPGRGLWSFVPLTEALLTQLTIAGLTQVSL